MNKRGMELALNTIILIVLGIAVLVALLFLFVIQTGIFTDFLKNSQQSNVDVIVNACNSLVTSQQTYSYCCDKKEVILDDKNKIEATCFELKDKDFISDRINSLDCPETC
jgi:hypothetical protein